MALASFAPTSQPQPIKDASLDAAFQRSVRQFEPSKTGFSAQQPGQFGIELTPNAKLSLTSGNQRLSSYLASFGRNGAYVPIGNAVPAIRTNPNGWPVATFRRQTVSEQYVNEGQGLHHWFQIHQRPAGSSEVLLKLQVSGAAKVSQLGQDSIQVKSVSSTLTYSGLKVWDATGKSLAARLQARPSQSQIVISIDDQQASYPITVDPVWTEQQKLSASDKANGDSLGYSLSLSGDTAIIGAPQKNPDLRPSMGAAYIFVRSGDTWTEQQKITASDCASGDIFGWSVAVSGDSVVVGAPQATPGGTDFAGAAYVFTRSGGVWTEQQKLVASDKVARDAFGSSVAISGNTVLVGKFHGLGTAYVFTRSGGSWTETQKLTGSDTVVGDQFAYSLAIDGGTAVIGALNCKVGGVDRAGAAYVFVHDGSSWIQQQKLTAADPGIDDGFGWAVAVQGNTAIATSPDNSPGGVHLAGSAYVFSRSGGAWTQSQKLTASDKTELSHFGWSVAISGDAAVVGALSAPDSLLAAGSAYIFSRTGATWTEQQKLVASDRQAGNRFGASVGISADFALIAAYNTSPDGVSLAGAAYAFKYRPSVAITFPTLIKYGGVPGIYGGLNGTGTVTLARPAPLGGTVINLLSDNAGLVVPSSVSISAGETTATFNFTTTEVLTDALVTVTGSGPDVTTGTGKVKLLANKVVKIALSKSSILHNEVVTGRVALAAPAQSNFVVTIANGNPSALAAPTTVTVLAGQTNANFTVTGGTVASDTVVSLTATPSNGTKSVAITVKPGGSLQSLTFQDSVIRNGATTTGTITLAGPAPVGGVTVALTSNAANVSVPASVTVPAGETQATFSIQSIGTKSVATTISATYDGKKVSAVLTIVRPMLAGLSLDKSSVKGGTENASLTVTLATAAPAGGVTVTLSSSKPGLASVPATVLIPAGATSATVTVTTTKVNGPVVVNLYGRLGTDGTKGVKLTVTK